MSKLKKRSSGQRSNSLVEFSMFMPWLILLFAEALSTGASLPIP